MRIAQIAPLAEAVPPRSYGGTERVVSFLTEELVRLGHEVTLFATADSVTAADLVAVYPRALRSDARLLDPAAVHLHLLDEVFHRAGNFDILHFHLDYWPFPLFSRQSTPFLSTLHGRLDLPELWPLFREYRHVPVVSVSQAQRAPVPWANWIATIHHGIPTGLLSPRMVRPRYLAFLGRIAPEKGVEGAIEIARRCGLPLKIAAKVDLADRSYYDNSVRPLLASSPHVEYLGEITDEDKADFLSSALALVFPGNWPEPFGLVMIEALACGTPVVAFDHGSVNELIEPGVTGFVVTGVDAAVKAVYDLAELPRAAVRRRFEERFTAARMADDYVTVYHRLSGTADHPAQFCRTAGLSGGIVRMGECSIRRTNA